MWLIHVGFMSYESGVSRRKNVMSTAMKNILTIAVVTPTFYYFGWYIYGCFEHGGPPERLHAGPTEFPRVLRRHVAVGRPDGAEPRRSTSASSSSSAFLLFSWTTASIMSGALIERARYPRTSFAVLLGSAVWIMDAAWGWSAGGWLRQVRLPRLDRVGSRARGRGRLHARRAAQPRAANRQIRPRGEGESLQTP